MPDQHSFDKLLSPISINEVQLKNRMVKTASSLGVATVSSPARC